MIDKVVYENISVRVKVLWIFGKSGRKSKILDFECKYAGALG